MTQLWAWDFPEDDYDGDYLEEDEKLKHPNMEEELGELDDDDWDDEEEWQKEKDEELISEIVGEQESAGEALADSPSLPAFLI